MGRVIAMTLLLVAVQVSLLWLAYYMGKAVQDKQAASRGYLTKRGAALLDRADSIVKELGVVSTLDNVEILTPQHKEAIERWRSDYAKWRG